MEDDWEPYMMAVLQRQKEKSDSDQNKESDTHSFVSIESLPTYPMV